MKIAEPVQPVPVERTANGQFAKGVSGNPGGRPKRTPAEQKAVEMLKELTPRAVEVIHGILENDKASLYARIQAAELILNRAMGRPETYLRVESADETQDEAAFSLLSLFEAAGEENPDAG